MPAGLDNLVLVGEEIRKKTFATANQGGGGVDSSGKKWKIGELEFEAQMRIMDNAVSSQAHIPNIFPSTFCLYIKGNFLLLLKNQAVWLLC